jgi:GntR family transcriptional regulator
MAARLDQPLYRDLAMALRQQIRHGAFALGEKIPTEAELGQRQGVSRNTVRQAVEQLVSEGVLDRQQGRGTFVRALPQPDPGLLSGPPQQDWAFRGIDVGWRTASIDLANMFGLPPDGELFSMTRLRLEDGRPSAVKRYFAPADLLRDAPPTEQEIDSAPFDAILLSRGARLLRMNMLVEPRRLDAADAALLDGAPSDLSLFTQRVGFDEHGRAVRLSQTVTAAERSRLFWSIRRPYGERGGGDFVD